MKHTLLFVIESALSVSAFAQAGPQESIALVPVGLMPTYVVDETSRTVEAVDYQHRSGASEVDLAGTALLPSADGKAKVHSKRGTIKVEADFGNLQCPTTFGAEYLITGIAGNRQRTTERNSNPDMPGMLRSERIISGISFRISINAESPSSATRTEYQSQSAPTTRTLESKAYHQQSAIFLLCRASSTSPKG